MKKICFFSGDITRSGGTERVGTIIANELQKDSELEVSFVSLWEKEETPFFEIDNSIIRNVLYEKETKGVYHFFGYIRRLRKFLKKNNADVLIDIDGILDMYSIPAKKGLDIKLVSWEQFGFYSNPFVNYRKITRKMAAKWADIIVVLTKKDLDNYKENLYIKHHIVTIGNPSVKAKREFGYDSDSKQICSVGRLSYDKGYDYLMEVANIVLKRNEDWRWIIVGEGEERKNIEEKIKEYGLESKIILTGRLKDLDEIYSKSAMLVCTSRYEGFGMMLIEAMSYGVPCVSFRCPEGPEEIIIDGENGALVDCFNIKKMAEEIEVLMTDIDKRMDCSKKAVVSVDKYSVDSVVSKWKKIITNV